MRHLKVSRLIELLAVVVTLVQPAVGLAGETTGVRSEIADRPRQLITIPPPTTAATVRKGIASGLPAALGLLNDIGLANQISDGLEAVAGSIAKDSTFIGSGGILVEATVESMRGEAGTVSRLSNRVVQYIGLGATPVDTKVAQMTRTVLEVAPANGWKRDLDKSQSFWISRTSNGRLKFSSISSRGLLSAAIVKITNKAKSDSDWQAVRAGEINRLAEIASRELASESARSQVSSLLKNRAEALAKRDQINEQLQKELDHQARLAKNRAVIGAMINVLDLAGAIATASEGLSPAEAAALGKSTSSNGVLETLGAFGDESTERSDSYRSGIESQNDRINAIDSKQLDLLNSNNVPTVNLPSGEKPIFRP